MRESIRTLMCASRPGRIALGLWRLVEADGWCFCERQQSAGGRLRRPQSGWCAATTRINSPHIGTTRCCCATLSCRTAPSRWRRAMCGWSGRGNSRRFTGRETRSNIPLVQTPRSCSQRRIGSAGPAQIGASDRWGGKTHARRSLQKNLGLTSPKSNRSDGLLTRNRICWLAVASSGTLSRSVTFYHEPASVRSTSTRPASLEAPLINAPAACGSNIKSVAALFC